MTRSIRTRPRPVRRSAALGALVAIAALVAVGCGGDDDSASKTSSKSASNAKQAAAGEITKPTASTELTDALGETATALTDAGCSFGTFDEERAKHVDEGDDLESNTFPPTNGRHYGDWAPFGLYTAAVDDGYAVHNLEHGGVAVWLGSGVNDDTTDAIAELLDADEKWLVAPRDDLEGIYSAAWATGLSCPAPAVAKLGADGVAEALDAWYDVVESTGSDAEKDVPAYAGAMKEPTPERDISTEAPF